MVADTLKPDILIAGAGIAGAIVAAGLRDRADSALGGAGYSLAETW